MDRGENKEVRNRLFFKYMKWGKKYKIYDSAGNELTNELDESDAKIDCDYFSNMLLLPCEKVEVIPNFTKFDNLFKLVRRSHGHARKLQKRKKYGASYHLSNIQHNWTTFNVEGVLDAVEEFINYVNENNY